MERFFVPKLLKAILVFGLTLFLVAIAPSLTYSQQIKAAATLSAAQAPVALGEQTIFLLESGVDSFSVQQQAQAVSERISTLADSTYSLSS